MTVDELLKVSEGLSWVSARLAALPENRDEAVQASLMCAMANVVVSELAKHLSEGVEPYEALRRTAIGDLAVPESTAALMKMLGARPER